MRRSPASTIDRSGRNDRGALSWLLQRTSITLCAALSSASVAINRLSSDVSRSSGHDRVREHAERDADEQSRAERQRHRPAVVVAERVADERPDRAERGGGEVQDARHPVDDDDRSATSAVSAPVAIPSRTNLSVVWLRNSVATSTVSSRA